MSSLPVIEPIRVGDGGMWTDMWGLWGSPARGITGFASYDWRKSGVKVPRPRVAQCTPAHGGDIRRVLVCGAETGTVTPPPHPNYSWRARAPVDEQGSL